MYLLETPPRWQAAIFLFPFHLFGQEGAADEEQKEGGEEGETDAAPADPPAEQAAEEAAPEGEPAAEDPPAQEEE